MPFLSVILLLSSLNLTDYPISISKLLFHPLLDFSSSNSIIGPLLPTIYPRVYINDMKIELLQDPSVLSLTPFSTEIPSPNTISLKPYFLTNEKPVTLLMTERGDYGLSHIGIVFQRDLYRENIVSLSAEQRRASPFYSHKESISNQYTVFLKGRIDKLRWSLAGIWAENQLDLFWISREENFSFKSLAIELHPLKSRFSTSYISGDKNAYIKEAYITWKLYPPFSITGNIESVKGTYRDTRGEISGKLTFKEKDLNITIEGGFVSSERFEENPFGRLLLSHRLFDLELKYKPTFPSPTILDTSIYPEKGIEIVMKEKIFPFSRTTLYIWRKEGIIYRPDTIDDFIYLQDEKNRTIFFLSEETEKKLWRGAQVSCIFLLRAGDGESIYRGRKSGILNLSQEIQIRDGLKAKVFTSLIYRDTNGDISEDLITDVGINITFFDALNIRGEIRNLQNNKVKLLEGHPLWGRIFLIGITAKLLD